jgi:integrative and conjugative element protein (TIGR02256 family)
MTGGAHAPMPITPDQQRALDELEVIAAEGPNIDLLGISGPDERGVVRAEVSIATESAGGGLRGEQPAARLRDRERFLLLITRDYPFQHPWVWVTHDRFSGVPHVQWRRHLCLYVSPSTEWQPADGMFGLMERLLLWLDRAAAGSLEAAGEPLHPPVAYSTPEAGAVILRADTPPVPDVSELLLAVLRPRDGDQVDIVGWLPLAEALSNIEDLSVPAGSYGPAGDLDLGLAVMLAETSDFEFPSTVTALRRMLAAHAVGDDLLLAGLSLLALFRGKIAKSAGRNDEAGSVYVVIGTPMRGHAGGARHQHVVAWRFDDLGTRASSLLDVSLSPYQAVRDLAPDVRALVETWLGLAELRWVRVYDARPQVTVRRDTGSPMAALAGRRVLLLGAGALGSQIATHLVRARVGELQLVDNSKVSPGVLVRQDFVDTDIDEFKALALARRLKAVDADVVIKASTIDAHELFRDDSGASGVDLIIDATANMALAERIERHLLAGTQHPPVITMLVGFQAARGIALVAPAGYPGAGADLLRKTKITVSTAARLRPFADDFFPDPPRSRHFQPEPGCSEATFTGSNAQMAALAGTLLLHAQSHLGDAKASMTLFDLGLDAEPHLETLSVRPDTITETAGYTVRIAPNVIHEWRAETRLMARLREPDVETGGVLLGEIDDACRVIWVSMATGPPPDSHASATAFVCGVEGVDDLVAHHDQRTRGAVRFLGLWHTHPYGAAAPSHMDQRGMTELLVPVAKAPRRALLVILGGPGDWEPWRDGHGEDLPDHFLQVCARSNSAVTLQAPGIDLSSALARAGKGELRRWPPATTAGPGASRRRRWPW